MNAAYHSLARVPSNGSPGPSVLLPEPEIARLQQSIAERPDAHPVIVGTGGIRKARWARPGMEALWRARHLLFPVTRWDRVHARYYAKNERGFDGR